MGTKKTLLLVLALIGIILFSCLICCCSSIVFLPKAEKYNNTRFFETHEDEFITLKDKHENGPCIGSGVMTDDEEIGTKKFHIYNVCDLDAVVLETGKGFSRTDYVYISDDSKIEEVNECSDGNGAHISKIKPHWHLCAGDWN